MYLTFSPYAANGQFKIRKLPVRETRKGRPQSLSAVQCLGFVLAWGRCRGSEMVLSLLFGVTTSVSSFFLRFGRRILVRVLSQDSRAKVQMPADAEIQEFNRPFSENIPCSKTFMQWRTVSRCTWSSLQIVWSRICSTTDGCMVITSATCSILPPNGVVICCELNAPGAMHDSTIAEWGNVYAKLDEVFERTWGCCVVDSAFSKGDYPFLIKSSQDHFPIAENLTIASSTIAEARQATSARQAFEWDMRALQGTFPRLKDRLFYEERGERKRILLCTVLLFIFRTRLIGINQILSKYMQHLSVEAKHLLGLESGSG